VRRRGGRAFLDQSLPFQWLAGRKPEATAAGLRDGWSRLATWRGATTDGHIYIVDAEEGHGHSGGINIYPREIEEVLFQHPAIAEAAVIGVPQTRSGREVAGLVVRRGGLTSRRRPYVASARDVSRDQDSEGRRLHRAHSAQRGTARCLRRNCVTAVTVYGSLKCKDRREAVFASSGR